MFLSDSNHQLFKSYLSKDKLNQYRRILESSPNLTKFSVTGTADRTNTSSSTSFGNSGDGSTTSIANDDEFVLELSTLLFLHQGTRDAYVGANERVVDDDGIDSTDDSTSKTTQTEPSFYVSSSSSTIIELRLEMFKITENAWRTLTTMFRSLPCLQILHLRQIIIIEDQQQQKQNHVGITNDNDASTIASKTFGTLLQTCPGLIEMHLVECDIDALTAQKLSLDLITKRRALQVLSLEGNAIGNIGVKSIAKALAKPKSCEKRYNNSGRSAEKQGHGTETSHETKCQLRALDIERVGCSMKDGLTALAEALKDNETLESLSFGGNSGLDDQSVYANTSIKKASDSREKSTQELHPFHQLLLTNTTLRQLQPMLRLPISIIPTIDFFLRMNKAGREKVLMKNPTDDRNVPKVLHYILHNVSDDPNIIYEFLRLQLQVIVRDDRDERQSRNTP